MEDKSNDPVEAAETSPEAPETRDQRKARIASNLPLPNRKDLRKRSRRWVMGADGVRRRARNEARRQAAAMMTLVVEPEGTEAPSGE